MFAGHFLRGWTQVTPAAAWEGPGVGLGEALVQPLVLWPSVSHGGRWQGLSEKRYRRGVGDVATLCNLYSARRPLKAMESAVKADIPSEHSV